MTPTSFYEVRSATGSWLTLTDLTDLLLSPTTASVAVFDAVPQIWADDNYMRTAAHTLLDGTAQTVQVHIPIGRVDAVIVRDF